MLRNLLCSGGTPFAGVAMAAANHAEIPYDDRSGKASAADGCNPCN
ncbi:hypothetical protein L195_g022892 [Trifolium pratense]|uniref:Uncharacterized protein n=1 Tax=Trifolium pratense TaxID=57577 RepID=A0A2K3N997_TRIPR|nr:hypothetical protein L195_g022892 [Trifolium pratense]